MSKAPPKLNRRAFQTSRALDFLNEKELVAQIGHKKADWPIVLLKELVDNALDACEEAEITPRIVVTVNESGVTVKDNGPGIPSKVVGQVLDFNVRVSSREAYVAPDRGRQGNALKTTVAIPFVLSGEAGNVRIDAQGVRHDIEMRIDAVRQAPVIEHQTTEIPTAAGTSIFVAWPNSPADLPRSDDGDENDEFLQNDEDQNPQPREVSPRLILARAKPRFLQIAEAFVWLNPHLSLVVDWNGERIELQATNDGWDKWRPSNPTDPHWYGLGEFKRLIGANIAWDAAHEHDRTLREFVAEFHGLTSTIKVSRVLESLGLKRARLTELADGTSFDDGKVAALLEAMKTHARAVKPQALGVIGEEHLSKLAVKAGGDLKTFKYKKAVSVSGDIPCVVESAFAYRPKARERRMVIGINWSPAIGPNPFRELGPYRKSLDSILEEQRAGEDEPVVFFLHVVCPRVSHADRGKSSVIVED